MISLNEFYPKQKLMINFTQIKFSSHDLPVLAANVPGFPSSLQTDDIYPINVEFDDVDGRSHKLNIDAELNIQIDGDISSIKRLYELMYAITKEEGKQAAYDYESNYFGPISYDTTTYLGTTEKIDELSRIFSFPYEPSSIQLQPLPHLNILRYYSLAKTGQTVAYKDYSMHSEGLKWQHRGVFRLPVESILATDEVLVVDNPAIADYLNSKGRCAIPLPSEQEMNYYDYPRLLEGTTVLFSLREYGQTYAYSFYPFASQLIENHITTRKVNTYNTLANRSIPDWVNQHSTDELLNAFRSNAEQLHASDIPVRGAYNRKQPDHGITEFNPAQDVKRSSMIYSYGINETVLSNPIREFRNSDLELMENLRPAHDKAVDSRLTLGKIDRIKHSEYLEAPQLYSFIRDFIYQYLYFEDEEVFDILTAWIMGTYVYRLFLAYPYIHFHGEKGTGKTTILNILSKLGFNGQTLTKATPSALTHQVHYHSSTLCVDEFEDYSSRRKSEDELSRFLNGGYHYRGSYKKRSGNRTVELNTYSPKAFGGTGEIFIETLRSRAIPISTLEKPKDIPKIEFSEFDQQTIDDIELIQLSCYAMALQQTSELIELTAQPMGEIKLPISKTKLSNRQLQLAKPLLTIAKFVGDSQVQNTILKGLDLCWSPDKADHIRIISALEDILRKTFENYQPDNIKNEKYYFITSKLLESDILKKYGKEFSVINRKGKFNQLLERHFGILRDDDYASTTQNNESVYKIPAKTYNRLKD